MLTEREIVRFYRTKCSACSWSEFGDEESVSMTPCTDCNSTGYIYEPINEYHIMEQKPLNAADVIEQSNEFCGT